MARGHETIEEPASGGPSPGSKKRWRGPVVSLVSLIVVVLASELGLRVTDYRGRFFAQTVNKTVQRWVGLTSAGILQEIDDPVRRYALRPGTECVVDGWTFRVSSHRSRGADFPLEKPEGERRLLCLGDSFAFGLWCDDDETLVASVARLASERETELGTGIRWRGINLGVPGYHSGQQLRALEQDGLALDPDAVLLYFNTNDIEQEGFFFDEELGVLRRDFLPLPAGLRRLLWCSHSYGWVVTRHRNRIMGQPTPHLDPAAPFAHVRADNQRATRDAIAAIARACEERGIPLFFVNQPLMTFMGDTRRLDWNLLPLVDWAEGMRAELGLPGVSLLGWMRGYGDGVDRMAGADSAESAPPPDFLLDAYFADERVQSAVAYAKGRAAERGLVWEELGVSEKLPLFGGHAEGVPAEIDFHLTGEGYGHMARVVHEAMRAEGLLP
jgi:lysophospholipase L1-like esterase